MLVRRVGFHRLDGFHHVFMDGDRARHILGTRRFGQAFPHLCDHGFKFRGRIGVHLTALGFHAIWGAIRRKFFVRGCDEFLHAFGRGTFGRDSRWVVEFHARLHQRRHKQIFAFNGFGNRCPADFSDF